MLLVAYAGAMWMFLSSAPKVFTLMVSDIKVAQEFYEQDLQLPVADIPLHYYHNYEQTLGLSSLDPIYMPTTLNNPGNAALGSQADGLWYQLKKNVQLHVIPGASVGKRNQQRHVCFDRECLEQILRRVQSRYVKFKVRQEKPMNFLVKTYDGRVIEMTEVETA